MTENVERRAPYSIRIPPWAAGVVVACAGLIGAVIAVDSRYVKTSEFDRHLETVTRSYVTKEQFDERARFRDEQLRNAGVEANAKIVALTAQVSRLADTLDAHARIGMHPGAADSFRAIESRFATLEANQRWSVEALQALLRRQGLATPVAPPPAPVVPPSVTPGK